MHHALEVEEILFNIFGHCHPGLGDNRAISSSSLAALARTCRAFKEPALDILWSELEDLSPLSRCLPEISHAIASGHREHSTLGAYKKLYAFTRPLEPAEWDILQSYTHRIWCIRDFSEGLDWKSVGTLPPTVGPLFPNLRSLHYNHGSPVESIAFLQLPFPSLALLAIRSSEKANLCMLQEPLKSFAKFSPNIRKLYISSREHRPKRTLSKTVSSCICYWANLQTVYCPDLTLDAEALAHLSHIPVLTQLTFMVPDTLLDQIIPSDSLLSFSNLKHLSLQAECSASISRLLSWTQLSAITEFTASVETCPSREDLASFLTSIQTCGMGNTIQDWSFTQLCAFESDPPPIRGSEAPLLSFDTLRPCMTFKNLRRMKLDFAWNVGLTDSELLTLASTWPRLEGFIINAEWGWNTLGGITPDGLSRLLEICRSLNSIALAIDTRGYTELLPRRPSLNLGAMRIPFSIDVVDSLIEEESMPAIADFLAGVVPPLDFVFTSWECWAVMEHPENETYSERWGYVYDWANLVVKEAFMDLFRPLRYISV